MLFWRKKQKQEPKSDEDLLAEAIEEAGEQAKKRAKKQKKRRGKFLLPAWLDRRILILFGVIFVLIIVDAVRRENQEFVATVTGISGRVVVQPREQARGRPAKINEQLTDGMVVNTGDRSSATLEFADGSVTTLGPASRLVIRLIEYSRGGQWRSRTFLLKAGRLWAHIGKNFGSESHMRVYTPSAVAAVRGTRYAIAYDTEDKETTILCNDGYVTAGGFVGEQTWVGRGGRTTVAYGKPVQEPEWMSNQQQQAFSQESLMEPIPPEHWIKTAELTITQLLDAPLTILGIGRCSWAVGAMDAARRSLAMEELRRLHQLLEGSYQYPEFVNPVTLEELSIPYTEARRMLNAFDGGALLKYVCLDNGHSFRMLARARDRNRTLYSLTPTGIRKIEE